MRLVAGGGGFIFAMAIAAACVRDSDAQVASDRRKPVVADDTASLAWVLRAVRGADPLLCELTVRQVDMHGWWSNWGPLGDSPIEGDSAAANVIRWIQHDHNDPAVVPRLSASLRDSDACVRRIAGAFLGRVKHPSAVAALLSAIDDASAETRYVAAIGLGLAEAPESQSALVRRLRDDSPAVRRASAWALGALEAQSALPALIAALERDPDPRVRQTAAWAIGRSHD